MGVLLWQRMPRSCSLSVAAMPPHGVGSQVGGRDGPTQKGTSKALGSPADVSSYLGVSASESHCEAAAEMDGQQLHQRDLTGLFCDCFKPDLHLCTFQALWKMFHQASQKQQLLDLKVANTTALEQQLPNQQMEIQREKTHRLQFPAVFLFLQLQLCGASDPILQSAQQKKRSHLSGCTRVQSGKICYSPSVSTEAEQEEEGWLPAPQRTGWSVEETQTQFYKRMTTKDVRMKQRSNVSTKQNA